MTKTTDVAIIGGGVIGAIIAYNLALRGISCTLFEKDRFASSASGATGGIIGPIWYVDHTIAPYWDMAMRSFERFPQLTADLREAGIDPEYRQNGVMKVALTEELHATLRSNLAWQENLDIGVHWIGREELLERETEISPAAQGAVYSPQEGNIKGRAFVQSLINASSNLGATCLEQTEVTSFEITGSRIVGLKTMTDTYHTNQVVLAAGAWTGLTNRWLQEPIPVRPIKGQRVTLRMPGFHPHCPVQSIVPQMDGTFLSCATREDGEFNHKITAAAIRQMLDNAIATFPILKHAEFVSAEAGVRPGSPDGMPVLGPIPGWQGVSVASGHDHVGMILSPRTGEMMADYIESGDSSPLDFFSIERFTDSRIQHQPKTLFSNIAYDR